MDSGGGRRRRRKPRPSPRASAWTIRYALGAYLVTAVAGAVIVIAMARRELRLGIGAIVLDGVMMLCLVPLYRQRRFRARDLGVKTAPLAKSVGLMILGVIAIAIVNAIWLQGLLGLRTPVSLGVTLHESTPEKVITGFAMAISAPVTEEIFFRGLLYRALRNRLNVAPAALIDGLLFGAIHATTYPLDTLPPRIAFGAVTCLLYERTGSLLPGIALHCFIDAAGFEAAITGHNYIVNEGFLALGTLLLVYSATRHLWREATARLDLRRMDRDERRAVSRET